MRIFHDVIYNYLSYDNVSFREKYKNKEKKIKTKEIEFCVINQQK